MRTAARPWQRRRGTGAPPGRVWSENSIRLLISVTEKTYRTRTGKTLTDADIEAMADDAERGYDPEVLKTRKRGRPMLGSRPSEVVPVRLDPDLRQAVEERAESEHTTTSEIIRQALRRFLDVT